MARFEITYDCTDGDWLSWRLTCIDFHDAAKAAFDRLHMAAGRETNKLNGARLLRIQPIPDIDIGG